MKRNWSHSIGTLALLASLSGWALAQDDPKPADPEATAESAPAPDKLNSIGLRYAGWMKHNGIRKFSPMGTAPNGLSISTLDYLLPAKNKSPYAKLTLRNIGDDDAYAGGMFVIGSRIIVKGDIRTLNFFADEPTQPGTSRRRNNSLQTKVAIAPNVGAYASYSNVQQSLEFSGPKPNRHQRSETYAAGVEGKMLGGYTGVNVSSSRISDQNGAQPTSAQRRIDGSYAIDVTPTVSLAANASYTKIQQNGLRDSSAKAVGLASTFDLGGTSALHLELSRLQISLPNAKNAYDRKRVQTAISFTNHDYGWTTSVSYRHKENERFNTDHSYVDVPSWDVYDLRMSRRLGANRLSIRGSWTNLRGKFTPQTNDPALLQWDDDAMFQVKLAGGNEKQQMYGVYTYGFKQNRARNVNLNTQTLNGGLSYTFNPKLLGYFEAGFEHYRSGTVFPNSVTSLTYYYRDGIQMTAGLDYAVSDNANLTASLNSYGTNNVFGRQFTFGYSRKLDADRSLQILVSPWIHNDRLYNLTGTSNTAISVQFKSKF